MSVDHIIVLGEVHLRQILQSYARYYNDIRTHRSLDKDDHSLVKFSESEASNHTPSWADFITTTPVFKFSVHTPAQAGLLLFGGAAEPTDGWEKR